ncbi:MULTISPECIES: hypothetical protein [unclassified Chelatococcus]|uniref:hypothetical protein n=1 Tax=unclassified Chelatococcus TaxID=2638111 RepID=UPI001BCE3F86|nr:MULTISPECIES: hypothetical protein [unclassified Chelatococcus]MBS7738373.1 hypothetical protein [Chelatococcus sp. HY11]MBX3547358.1 hypothetical protein [Chelatococcus sp.]MCO5077281.1 hypothetical protein [Chelatococcus sp.]CAH1670730.1 conserved hypothetical protein [Hyphomicrobiales bacterium]
MPYVVKAECVDVRSGKRFFPGDKFHPEPDEDQAARLIAAGCLRLDGATPPRPAAPVTSPSSNEGGVNIEDMTVDALKALAAEKSIDLGDAKLKADIIAAIKAKLSEGGA